MHRKYFGCTTGRTITSATDIYALSVIFYEALTGKKLFEDENPFIVMKRHQEEDPSPFIVSKKIPDRYQPLLLAMLDKNPARRPDFNHILSLLSGASLQVPGYRGLDVEPVTLTYGARRGDFDPQKLPYRCLDRSSPDPLGALAIVYHRNFLDPVTGNFNHLQ
ncbi:MAG: hypothetical protein ACMUIP_16320 [bacterium]